MGFFKEATGDSTPKAIGRVQTWSWVMIYGGLVLLVLGVFTRSNDGPTGWTMVVVGAVVAFVGASLIWVRSRMSESAADNER